MVSQLNEMLEDKNNQKSLEALEKTKNKWINKEIKLQVNEHKQTLEIKEGQVELRTNVIEKLKLYCQRIKENSGKELANKDNSHNEA